jgi:hypothetical protein
MDRNTFRYNVSCTVGDCTSQETEGTTRLVENVASTTKGLHEKNTTCEWDDDGKIGN